MPERPLVKYGSWNKMLKTCKACGIKEYPMWYSEEYCSRSCAVQRYKDLKNQIYTLRKLLLEKK